MHRVTYSRVVQQNLSISHFYKSRLKGFIFVFSCIFFLIIIKKVMVRSFNYVLYILWQDLSLPSLWLSCTLFITIEFWFIMLPYNISGSWNFWIQFFNYSVLKYLACLAVFGRSLLYSLPTITFLYNLSLQYTLLYY